MKKERYPSIRIFKSPLLEWTTHVHPIVPLILWTPVAGYWLALSGFDYGWTVLTYFLWGFIGLLSWTLVEYVFHRYVFHFPAKSEKGKFLVFLFHGLHHDDPNDPTRLVFPPVPAIIIVTILFHLFSLVIPADRLHGFMAFFLIGYLCYDYIHYGTHHFPMKSKIGRYLKKYHLQHHFRKENAKYGVSSPLWDYLLGTVEGAKEDAA